MSLHPWHGLSHKKAWSHVGDSYADIAHEDARGTEENALPPTNRQTSILAPAGVSSCVKPKGAGSFQMQNGWSLSNRGSAFNSYSTEVIEQYKSPPSDARPAESQAQKGKLSSFPKETYPSDFRTYTQIDYDAVRLVDCKKPARAQRPVDSGIMLGTQPSVSTDIQSHTAVSVASPRQDAARSPLTDGTMRDSAGIVLPTYNIITGDSPQKNDKARYWRGQNMDFRRQR